MSARIGVIVMTMLLALYVVLVGGRAVALVGTGDPVAITMGLVLIVLPVIAIWGVTRELMFGSAAARLGKQLEREGALPDEAVAVHTSGRVLRADADAAFPRYRDDAVAHPEDWRTWYRLGIAYDAAGDRKRARSAIRTAIKLERAAA